MDESPILNRWLTHGIPRGKLHEIFAVNQEQAASAAGFAVALASYTDAAPLLWLRTQNVQRRAGLLHAHGLVDMGLNVSSLFLATVPDESALLRCAADAARCSGLGAVLIEAWGRAPAIDLTASRRLMLAAERSGVTVLMLRVGASPVPSAAETRWEVSAQPSMVLEANAPGAPCFEIELLRQRGGPAGKSWRVEWNRDQKKFLAASISGAGVSVAVDRTAAGGSSAFVHNAA